MKYIGIKKVNEAKFITRYNVEYETESGNPKIYEIVSRKKDLVTLGDLQNRNPDAVVMIITDESGEHILLNKEYRLAVGNWVYNFPAGLIDPNERPEAAAIRELKEETGLDITGITNVLPPSYSAVGISNERTAVVFGIASGEFQKSNSEVEEIIPGWYTKAEVMKLIYNEDFPLVHKPTVMRGRKEYYNRGFIWKKRRLTRENVLK